MTERYSKQSISNVSWRDMLTQDPYYWLTNSFQYSENVNVDDELHWIKLSQKPYELDYCENCHLVDAWNKVFAIPLNGWMVKYITMERRTDNTVRFEPHNTNLNIPAWKITVCNAVIFQDCLWIWVQRQDWRESYWSLFRINVDWTITNPYIYIPYDHLEDTDESISDPTTVLEPMRWISCMLNYNNARLVIWDWINLRVYYPELDKTKWTQDAWKTWWKIVQKFEWWMQIVWLTNNFEYLKVWVEDEWWNSKVFFYQWNNDLRNTFVYNLVDLTGTKVLRTYNINNVDYYVASLDWTDWYVSFYKMVGNEPIALFKQRWWLTHYDVNQKAWYFVWPTSMTAWYLDWYIYIADSYWVFKFEYTANWLDKWYMKWKLRNSTSWMEFACWLCVNQNFCWVSDKDWIKVMRLYDTWVDWYQPKWILISREIEWDMWWALAKILDQVRLWTKSICS